METTIYRSIDQIETDINEIQFIDPDISSDRVQELVSDIKIQFADVNQFNFDELSGSTRLECTEKLEKVIQKIEDVFGNDIISKVEENELKDAIGQAMLHAKGISYDHLPMEILLPIIDTFNHEQIEDAFIGLSKKISEIAQDQSLLYKKVPLDQRALQRIHKFVEHDLSLDVLSKKDLEILKRTKVLDLSEVNLSQGVLGKIVNLCPQIQHLKIQSGVTDETLLEVPETVTSLDVSECHSITVEGFDFLMLKLRNLTQVNFEGCHARVKVRLCHLVQINKSNKALEKFREKHDISIGDMFVLQMEMNKLSQIREFEKVHKELFDRFEKAKKGEF